MNLDISFGVALVAGFLSFFSPCILPLLPVYVAQLAEGVSRAEQQKSRVFVQSLIFVTGFTFVFAGLGAVSGTLGKFFALNREILLKAGGIFVVLMGLNLAELLKVPAFARHWAPLHRLRVKGALSSFFLGMILALGWTPCVGPVLASVLTLAAMTGSAVKGVVLLSVYSLGMAVPFIVLALTVDRFPAVQNALRRYSGISLRISGILLVILGLLIFFNKLGLISAYLAF
ncbi:MAG: cytochrome c biogenesis CcdA family protein [Bacillota bacterium]